MSKNAARISLAIDWDESEMFDELPQFGLPSEATEGERLAWICLLCYLRATGRNQPRFVVEAFATAYRIDIEDVNGILNRAGLFGFYRLHLGRIVISDWKEWGSANRSRRPIPSHVRAEVLIRDGGRCRYCGDPADTLDHLMPHSRGGEDTTENLVACCRTCNTRKHARTPVEAGMALLEITDGN